MKRQRNHGLPSERYILFGVELSYYSAKVRAYLRWKGIDFEERPADAAFYESVCEPRIGRRMIPLVITPEDEAIQDTTLVLDHFESKPEFGPSFSVTGQVQGFVDSLIELYADDCLVVPSMLYRWNYDAEVTTLEIGMAFAPDSPKDEQREVGAMVSKGFRGALPWLGVTDETAPSIEASWEATLADLDAHFRQYPFLFGHRPAKADFALLGALYAHQYRDATSGALLRSKALAVAHYVERMIYPKPYHLGEYLPNDEVPETLVPVLSRMMNEHIPFLSASASAVDEWKDANSGGGLPEDLGTASTTVEGVQVDRMIQPYAMWLLRRALTRYQALSGVSKQSANDLLSLCKGEAFSEIQIRHTLDYDDRQLRWA